MLTVLYPAVWLFGQFSSVLYKYSYPAEECLQSDEKSDQLGLVHGSAALSLSQVTGEYLVWSPYQQFAKDLCDNQTSVICIEQREVPPVVVTVALVLVLAPKGSLH